MVCVLGVTAEDERRVTGGFSFRQPDEFININ